MPHLSILMPKTLIQKRFENIVNGTLITNQITDVKNTFTAWDRCMSRLYCEWPAIIGIAIGGLILLSIAVCVTRRLCCAMSFCCSCLSFLSCGNCAGCCDGKRHSSSTRVDRTSNFMNQGYVAPKPMMAGGMSSPQYAHFPTVNSSGKPINEDALPAMPSWDTAAKVHVLDEEVKILEPENMNSPTSQKVPLMTSPAPVGSSSPLTQNRPDLSPFQPRLDPTTKSSYRSNESTYQTGSSYQDRNNREFDNSFPPTPSTDNYFRGDAGGHTASPMNSRGRVYGQPVQMPYAQNNVSSPRFAPNRYDSPGPGRMYNDR